MRSLGKYGLLLGIVFTVMSCRVDNPGKDVADPSLYKEPLIKANKQIVRTENEQIDDLLKRYEWKMHKTGTGLRYMILKTGEGKQVQEDDIIRLDYVLKVITGDVVYSSEVDGPLEFRVGKGNVGSGLDEGVRLLHDGDKARFVIPSYLAYGLIGDQNKIGKKATLIYEIEHLEIVE